MNKLFIIISNLNWNFPIVYFTLTSFIFPFSGYFFAFLSSNNFSISHMFDLLHAHVSSLLQQFQLSEGMEEHSSCSIDNATVEELDCLHPRPASSFEHSFGSESFSDNSQSTSGKFTFLFFISLNMMMIIHILEYKLND
jgi:hypothetical protein